MKTAVKKTAADHAKTFLAECREGGWRVDVAGQTVSIEKQFAPGDRAAFCECDAEAYGLLASLPGRGGSVWGTDGGSVGGHVGMVGGYYRLNRSSVGKRVADSIALNRLFGH